MKLIGLMLVRNEEWVLGASLRVALKWCDDVIVYQHLCTDDTPQIANDVLSESLGRVLKQYEWGTGDWLEMDLRQKMLSIGRETMGGTHFAMIDADEMLTHNLLPSIRGMVESLQAGQVLDLPMINPHRGFIHHRDDHSEHSQSQLSVAFCDAPYLTWQPRNGYHFHQRCPQGAGQHINPFNRNKACGGSFHLQWLSWERLVWKHRWYAMNERIRWPNKYTVQDVNRIYSAALDETGLQTKPIPTEWWGDYRKDLIDLNHVPWHKEECERMAKEHPEALEGLSIAGWPK